MTTDKQRATRCGLIALVVANLPALAFAQPAMVIQQPLGGAAVLSGTGFPAGCQFSLEAVGGGVWSNRVAVGPISVSSDGSWGPWNFNYPALAENASDFLARGMDACASTLLRAANTSSPYPRIVTFGPFDPGGVPMSMTVQTPELSPSQIIGGEGLRPNQQFILVLGDVPTNAGATDSTGRFEYSFGVSNTPGLPRAVKIQYVDSPTSDAGTETDGPYPHRVTLASGAVVTLQARDLTTTIGIAGLPACDYVIELVSGGNFSNRQMLGIGVRVDWSGLFTARVTVPGALLSATDYLIEGWSSACSDQVFHGHPTGGFPQTMALALFDPSSAATTMTIQLPVALTQQVIRGTGLPPQMGFVVRLGGIDTNYTQTNAAGDFAGNFDVTRTPAPPRAVVLRADDGSTFSGQEADGSYPHAVALSPSGTVSLETPASSKRATIAGSGFPPGCFGTLTALPGGESPFASVMASPFGLWSMSGAFYPPEAESAASFRWDGQGACEGRRFLGANPGGDYPRVVRMREHKPAEVIVDVKPGSCPNAWNPASRGVLPLAILGTGDFDVTTVDLASLRVEGVAPLRSTFEDVSAPSLVTGVTSCPGGPDGKMDLVLHVSTVALASAIDTSRVEPIPLRVTGKLLDGVTEISGTDLLRSVPPSRVAR